MQNLCFCFSWMEQKWNTPCNLNLANDGPLFVLPVVCLEYSIFSAHQLKIVSLLLQGYSYLIIEGFHHSVDCRWFKETDSIVKGVRSSHMANGSVHSFHRFLHYMYICIYSEFVNDNELRTELNTLIGCQRATTTTNKLIRLNLLHLRRFFIGIGCERVSLLCFIANDKAGWCVPSLKSVLRCMHHSRLFSLSIHFLVFMTIKLKCIRNGIWKCHLRGYNNYFLRFGAAYLIVIPRYFI